MRVVSLIIARQCGKACLSSAQRAGLAESARGNRNRRAVPVAASAIVGAMKAAGLINVAILSRAILAGAAYNRRR